MERRRMAVVAAAVAALGLAFPQRGRAATAVATWGDGTGNWSNLSNWTGTSAVPNNAGGTTYEAVINSGTVTLDQDVTVQNLTVAKAWYTMPNSPELASNKTLTVMGAFYWDHGVLSGTGTINAMGSMTLDPATWLITNRQTINNYGTAAWLGSFRYALVNGGTINNMAGATFDARADSTISNGGAGTAFNNYGLLVKSQTTGWDQYSYISNANNFGAVEVNAGGLYLYSGNGTGTFSVAAGSTLFLDKGYTLAASSVLSGAGTISLGTVTVQGTDNVTGATIITGETEFAAGAKINSNAGLKVSNGGHVAFNSGAPVVFNGPSMLAGSFGEGSIGGSDDLTFSKLTWNGGTFATTNIIHLSGLNSITGFNEGTVDHTTVENSGTITADVGLLLPGSTFNNLAGATFNVNVPTAATRTATIGDFSAADGGSFNNVGTFAVVSANNGAFFGSSLNNTGTIDVQNNSLTFMRGITSSGKIHGAQYTSLTFGASNANMDTVTHNLLAGSQLKTDGAVSFVSGTANIAGLYHNTGQTAVSGGATVNFLPGAIVETAGSRLTVSSQGIVNLNSGSLVTFRDMNINGTVTGSDSLAVTGTLNGSGTVSVPLIISGTLSPGNSPGILKTTGELYLLSGSHSLFELGGRTRTSTSTTYDFVEADGQTSLGGTLGLTFWEGFGWLITPADTLTLISSPTALSGSFDNVVNGQRLMTQDGFGSFVVNYGVGSPYGAYELVVSNYQAGAIPEPSGLALLGVSGLLLGRRRVVRSSAAF